MKKKKNIYIYIYIQRYTIYIYIHIHTYTYILHRGGNPGGLLQRRLPGPAGVRRPNSIQKQQHRKATTHELATNQRYIVAWFLSLEINDDNKAFDDLACVAAQIAR